jgi:four helix bundle protein
MQKSNAAYIKAYDFAIQVVGAYKQLCQEKHEFVLSKQLLRCGTSIGANLAEANQAISENDFSSKVSIAYKETKETQYWLNLLKDTGYLDEDRFHKLFMQADEIGAILFTILKKTRMNK